jgi:hypothetical protein
MPVAIKKHLATADLSRNDQFSITVHLTTIALR